MRQHLLLTFLLLLIFSIPGNLFAQPANISQLKNKLKALEQRNLDTPDTAYINTLNDLGFIYADSYPDSAFNLLQNTEKYNKAINYDKGEVHRLGVLGNAYQTKGNFIKALENYEEALAIANHKKIKKEVATITANIALVYLNQGNYPLALDKFYKSLETAEKEGDKALVRNNLNNIGIIQFYQGNMDEAAEAYQKTIDLSAELKDTTSIIFGYNNLGEVSIEQNKLAQALEQLNKAYQLAEKKQVPDLQIAVDNSLGNTYYRLDSLEKAASHFNDALKLAERISNARALCKANIGLANIKYKQGLFNEGLVNALNALGLANDMGQAQLQRDANKVVADFYEKLGDENKALNYFKSYKTFSDSLVNIENERQAANFKAGYEFSKKELQFEKEASQQRWIIFSIIAALLSLLIITVNIFRNRKKLNKTNEELHQKNKLIEGQKIQAEETLAQLKETQTQLIHAEKMASLGELTAGIAHEIQNPLNFVNNFSEVNNELITELKNEILKPESEKDEALVSELLTDIADNLNKINNHGKRADAIVKGMLQHSRSSSGQKEPTDINALCDEYLRLSYHGLRAKDKSFNATLKTDFDESIGKVNVLTQELGRVILNLLTNAFYAVDEKKKSKDSLHETQNENAYEPTVSISTKKISNDNQNKISITVSDNGNGIPKEVLEKIFQPFFTTKPTGKGTGLGLSMSYDIITKGHNGTIEVETKVGNPGTSGKNIGTTFIITLPN